MTFSITMRGFGRNPIPDAARLRRGIRKALDRAAEQAERDFASHGRHYSGGLDVDTTEIRDGVEITTDDDRFAYVALGTPPHTITARSGGGLAFPSGPYQAKTTPGVIPSRPGGRSGDFVVRQSVQHHGIEARETHIEIADAAGEVLLGEIAKVLRG
jgi:hypothetical protein